MDTYIAIAAWTVMVLNVLIIGIYLGENKGHLAGVNMVLFVALELPLICRALGWW